MENKLATQVDIQELKVAIQELRFDSRRDLQSEASGIRTEVQQEFKAVRTEMQQEFKAVRTEMQQEFKAVRTELQQAFQELRNLITQSELKLTLRMGGMFAASIAILTAINKLT